MKKIKSILFWVNCLLPVVLVASYFIPLDYLYEPGQQLGRVAIILLWLISIPGIVKRLGFKGKIAKIGINLRVIRRQLGIMLCQLGVIHYFWMVVFFYLQYGFPTDPNRIPKFQTFGLVALLLFLPLFITSNNFSTKYLKKAWHWLHRLIYLATLLLVFHLGLNAKISGYFFAFPTVVILLLELASLVKVLMSKF